MQFETIKSNISDNYFYAVADDAGDCIVVDPVDADAAVDRIGELGWNLVHVVNTHRHHDHVAGDDAVLAAFEDATLVAARGDAEAIESAISSKVDRRISGGDALEVGDLEFTVYDTPGHTPGHVSLRIGDYLLSGDTIFVGGAGNCSFGGDPGVLFRTFHDVLSEIPDGVTFCPGHDYSVRDIEFILSIEPDNEVAEEMLTRARASGDEIFLTTLGEERSYSPFFRWDDDNLRNALAERHGDTYARERDNSASEAEAVFRTVRALRNDW